MVSSILAASWDEALMCTVGRSDTRCTYCPKLTLGNFPWALGNFYLTIYHDSFFFRNDPENTQKGMRSVFFWIIVLGKYAWS